MVGECSSHAHGWHPALCSGLGRAGLGSLEPWPRPPAWAALGRLQAASPAGRSPSSQGGAPERMNQSRQGAGPLTAGSPRLPGPSGPSLAALMPLGRGCLSLDTGCCPALAPPVLLPPPGCHSPLSRPPAAHTEPWHCRRRRGAVFLSRSGLVRVTYQLPPSKAPSARPAGPAGAHAEPKPGKAACLVGGRWGLLFLPHPPRLVPLVQREQKHLKVCGCCQGDAAHESRLLGAGRPPLPESPRAEHSLGRALRHLRCAVSRPRAGPAGPPRVHLRWGEGPEAAPANLPPEGETPVPSLKCHPASRRARCSLGTGPWLGRCSPRP